MLFSLLFGYFVCSFVMWCRRLFHGVGGSGSSGVSCFWHSVSSSCSVLFVCVFFSCIAFVSLCVCLLFFGLVLVCIGGWFCQ